MENKEELLRRIAELEAENQRLRRGFFQPSREETVRVPEPLSAPFDLARRSVGDYFRDACADPARALIEIGGQRYVLVRASSLSLEFLDTILQLYRDRGEEEATAVGRSLLFDIAHSMGASDAVAFHARMSLVDPVARLSAGPVHFAYTGWALVDIKPESHPSPDQEFFLAYDHPYSFEAGSWIAAGRRSETPVCIMNAGYSSGWCEKSFGVQLTAVEVTCRARGDASCSFVMAPPDRIRERIRERFGADYRDPESAGVYIPTYFDRKLREEQQQERIRQLQKALAEIKTLSGLIPICANCKNIRDDAGYWHQVEAYVRERSRADFSHGLCPDCAAKLYPRPKK
jgi:predicted hydrocarbon binding protein